MTSRFGGVEDKSKYESAMHKKRRTEDGFKYRDNKKTAGSASGRKQAHSAEAVAAPPVLMSSERKKKIIFRFHKGRMFIAGRRISC